jgi:hypothetical protein
MYGFRDAGRASRALEQAAATEDLQALRVRCEELTLMLAKAQPVERPAAV